MAAPIDLSAQAALWFLIATLPIAFWVIWSDLRAMRIPNRAVLALLAVFVVLGPFLLPLELFAWQFLHLVVVLLVGITLNAAGVLGAGDAKFAAAAAPFVARGDIGLVMMLLAITLAAAFVPHRLAARSPLRHLAPDWESWTRHKAFPMGLSLGSTLSIYLLLGVLYGQ